MYFTFTTMISFLKELNYGLYIKLLSLMKILGIGIDLVMNSRIEKIITKSYAERFIKKFLH